MHWLRVSRRIRKMRVVGAVGIRKRRGRRRHISEEGRHADVIHVPCCVRVHILHIVHVVLQLELALLLLQLLDLLDLIHLKLLHLSSIHVHEAKLPIALLLARYLMLKLLQIHRMHWVHLHRIHLLLYLHHRRIRIRIRIAIDIHARVLHSLRLLMLLWLLCLLLRLLQLLHTFHWLRLRLYRNWLHSLWRCGHILRHHLCLRRMRLRNYAHDLRLIDHAAILLRLYMQCLDHLLLLLWLLLVLVIEFLRRSLRGHGILCWRRQPSRTAGRHRLSKAIANQWRHARLRIGAIGCNAHTDTRTNARHRRIRRH